MIDFKAEVEARKEVMLEDLISLLRINSERDDSQVDDKHPFGPGPVKALEHFLAMAERDGYQTRNIDNYAGDFEFGQGEEVLGIFAHLDVVPAGAGWDTDPYEPVIKDNRIYARGSSDDKGPTLACYYALKIIKDLGLPVSKKVRFIVGTDEESGWGDMDYYFAHNGLKDPDFGFSPDAEFPIINGEKGNVQVLIKDEATNGGSVKLVAFEAGLRTNMVPGIARATVVTAQAEALVAAFQDFLVANPQISGSAETDGDDIKFVVNGKQVHGAMPETGENAGTYLANFLQNFDFGGTAKSFLTYLGTPAHQDTIGEKFGVNYTDDVMGPLSMNVGIQKFVAGQEAFINFNFRYPKGITPDEIVAGLATQLNGWDVTPTIGGHAQVPHYVAPTDPIVETLLRVYHDQTGLPAHDQVIGGGTYGRLMARGVAFGALFPDSPDTMHQVNEFALLDDLYRSIAIYAQAIAEITNLD